MVKKFYYGLVSLKYAYAMFGIPLVIFTIAFVETKSHHPVFKIFMGICAVILAAVMVFYYRDKLRIRKTIRAVKDVNAYLSGGMVDRTYILEDRMLACAVSARMKACSGCFFINHIYRKPGIPEKRQI